MAATTKTKKITGKILYHGVCLLLCVIMLYPLLWMVFSSFKPSGEVFSTAAELIPRTWTIDNYVNGWKGFLNVSFGDFFQNSFLVAVTATLGAVVSSAIISFGFARLRFSGSKLWFSMVMLTMMLPFQVVMVPQYLMFNKLGMINTYYPLILPYFFGQGFFIFLDVQFIQGIPRDLDEAARIDGCSTWQIFLRVILPLIVPALVTTTVFSFIWRWDDFLAPLVYLSRTPKYTMALALKLFSDPSAQSDWGAMFAMSSLSLVPAFAVFAIFQKYLVEGVATTGMKG